MHRKEERFSEKYIAVRTFHLGDLNRSVSQGDIVWWDGSAADFGDGAPVAYSKLRLAVNARWLMKYEDYEAQMNQRKAFYAPQAQSPQQQAPPRHQSYNAGGGSFAQPEARGNYSSHLIQQNAQNAQPQRQDASFGMITSADSNIVGTLDDFAPKVPSVRGTPKRQKKSGNKNNNVMRIASANPNNEQVHITHAVAFGQNAEIFNEGSVSVGRAKQTSTYNTDVYNQQQVAQIESLDGDQVVVGSMDTLFDEEKAPQRYSFEEAQRRFKEEVSKDNRFASYKRDTSDLDHRIEHGIVEPSGNAHHDDPHFSTRGRQPNSGVQMAPRRPEVVEEHAPSIRTGSKGFSWDKTRHWKQRLKDILENYADDPEALEYIFSVESEGVIKNVKKKLGL